MMLAVLNEDMGKRSLQRIKCHLADNSANAF